MSFLQEIATELQQRQLAMPVPVTGGLPELIVGEFVESPAALQVRLMETGAMGDGIRTQEARGAVYVNQLVQFVVRGVDYLAARNLAFALYTFANGGIRSTYLSGTYYLGLDALQTPTFMGRDENDRWFIGFNAVALKVPS